MTTLNVSCGKTMNKPIVDILSLYIPCAILLQKLGIEYACIHGLSSAYPILVHSQLIHNFWISTYLPLTTTTIKMLKKITMLHTKSVTDNRGNIDYNAY